MKKSPIKEVEKLNKRKCRINYRIDKIMKAGSVRETKAELNELLNELDIIREKLDLKTREVEILYGTSSKRTNTSREFRTKSKKFRRKN